MSSPTYYPKYYQSGILQIVGVPFLAYDNGMFDKIILITDVAGCRLVVYGIKKIILSYCSSYLNFYLTAAINFSELNTQFCEWLEREISRFMAVLRTYSK